MRAILDEGSMALGEGRTLGQEATSVGSKRRRWIIEIQFDESTWREAAGILCQDSRTTLLDRTRLSRGKKPVRHGTVSSASMGGMASPHDIGEYGVALYDKIQSRDGGANAASDSQRHNRVARILPAAP